MERRPRKLNTAELFEKIERLIILGRYHFTSHALMRSFHRRNVTEVEVMRILFGHKKWHEKAKDRYVDGASDWNYHIRGKNFDEDPVRIVISFEERGLVVITVINLCEV